jgi:transposase
MESTGAYWKPVFNIWAGSVEVLLVKAPHVKAVPGPKTDVHDAAWLAARLPFGLVRARVIPPLAQRERRDLTRYRRPLIRDRATVVNRVQKRLADATIKLAAVVTEMMGVSGRSLLAALVAGRTDPQALAEWANGRWRDTREPRVNALESRVTPHPRLVLTALWCPIDSVDETMARLAARIAAIRGPVEEAVALLETLPGVARHAAERIVAEIGPDMSRVPRAADLASWAGVAPGNHERAGTRASGKPRQGTRLLRTVLTQVAQAAARTTGTSLAAP